jgi:RNA polymerase sigma-70 factor, ECF subfamily
VKLLKTSKTGEIEKLYIRRYSAFCRLALGITGTSEGAHEAVQEGFARALAHSDDFRGDSSLETWIWRIVWRAALDERRALPPETTSLHESPSDDMAVFTPLLPRAERDPELDLALKALTQKQRLIVFLRYFVDLPLKDIATLTGLRSGTVSATLDQAKRELARRLDDRTNPSRFKEAAR